MTTALGVPFFVTITRSDKRSALSTKEENLDRACLSDMVFVIVMPR